MTALRRLTAVGLLALLLALPGAASSSELEGHGWWWRAQTGLVGVPLPVPPDVPEDGLLVESAPDGPTAIAAVRFELVEGETDPVLSLTVATDGGGAAAVIAACPTVARWTPSQGERWEFAPEYDCERGQVDGVRSEDGATWTWELAPLLQPQGVLDVVLVDGGQTPFHIAFEAPTAASLSTTRAAPPPPDLPDPVVPPPAQDQPAQPPGTSAPPVSAPPPVRPEVGAPAPPPAAPPAAEVAAPAAPTAPTGGAAAGQPEPAATSTQLPPLAYGLMGMLAALILTDVLAAGQGLRAGARPWRAPAGEGGVGRFRRDRDEAPAPLW